MAAFLFFGDSHEICKFGGAISYLDKPVMLMPLRNLERTRAIVKLGMSLLSRYSVEQPTENFTCGMFTPASGYMSGPTVSSK